MATTMQPTTVQSPRADYPAGALLALRLLTVVGSLTFFVWTLLHLGVEIPLGAMVLSEPFSPPALMVEALCGLALAVGAVALFMHQRRAWDLLFGGHIFAFGGVTLGMIALALVPGPRSVSNDIYHVFINLVLVINLVLLQRPGVRETIETQQ
jgi:hypothetical protein